MNTTIPMAGKLNSTVLESNLIPEYDVAVVSHLCIFGRSFTVADPDPGTPTLLRLMMLSQQDRLCAAFWRFIGAA